MYDMGTRKRALALVAEGRSFNSVSRETGISRAAIRSWQVRLEPLDRSRSTPCPRCCDTPRAPDEPASYAYLLGLYLGDGYVSLHRRGVYFLRIACADAWPGLIDACATAMRAVRPANKVCRVQRQGCHYVTCSSKHWPCLFPQHGPGRKHERRIALEPWQQAIVDAHPWEFIRGTHPLRRLPHHQLDHPARRRRAQALRISAVLLHQHVDGHRQALHGHSRQGRRRVEAAQPESHGRDHLHRPQSLRRPPRHPRGPQVLTAHPPSLGLSSSPM